MVVKGTVVFQAADKQLYNLLGSLWLVVLNSHQRGDIEREAMHCTKCGHAHEHR